MLIRYLIAALVTGAGPDATPVVSPSTVAVVTLPRVQSWRWEPNTSKENQLYSNPLVRQRKGDPAGTYLVARYLLGGPAYEPTTRYGGNVVGLPPARVSASPESPLMTEQEWDAAKVVSRSGTFASTRSDATGAFVNVGRQWVKLSGKMTYSASASTSPDGRFVAATSCDVLKRGFGMLDGPPVTLTNEYFELFDVATQRRLVFSQQKKSSWTGSSWFAWVGSQYLAVLLEDHAHVSDGDPRAAARMLWIDLESLRGSP